MYYTLVAGQPRGSMADHVWKNDDKKKRNIFWTQLNKI